ncbi:Guanidinobutyrase [Amycolatopsis sp. CA-230715]|nr:Guanidinobutyrase [Amycolatopsis sp. CA-230715]
MNELEVARNSWRIELPRENPPSGPIELRRYLVTPAYSGIPTFYGTPLCLDNAALRASKCDVAVVGAPVDLSTGQRGAAYGPRAIRADERYLYSPPELLRNSATRVSPFSTLKVVDYGDAAVDPFSIENSMEPIRGLVREIAELRAMPVVLGGDHTLLWPSAGAVASVYGPQNVAIIHFDAHPDCHRELFGHKVSHTTPIARLIDDGVPGTNIIQVGLRTASGPDDEELRWMRRNGLRSHAMAEIEHVGMSAVVDTVIAEAKANAKHVYISLDIDVLDPAFAPGTGTPESAGLTTRELFMAFRRLCAETDVVGMDVVEVAPHLDPGYTTALNARRVIFEALSGKAQRKIEASGRKVPGPIS